MLQTRPRPGPTATAPPVNTTEARRLRHDLRHSVREGGFSLSFQTRRCLRDQTRLGADAQVRWPSRGRGMVQASVFTPVLDECGLSGDLLAWTLAAACRAAATWPQGVVSVNVPAASVRDGALLVLLGEALAETGLDAERLEISLQDGDADGDCPDTLLALSALRDLGVGVALEEYGRTGACLVKLKHLPLTAIKLDRSLVRDVHGDHAAAALVGSLIGFAHTLGMAVAAGVETPAQRAKLVSLGCDAGIERSAAAE